MRIRVGRLGAAFLMVAASLVGIGVAAQPIAVGADVKPSDLSVIAARRAQAGLDSSSATVQKLLGDPASVARGASLGIPVAAGEEDGLRKRFAIHDEAPDVIAAAQSLSPATFGGGWVDVAVGTVYVGFTDDDVARTTTLRATSKHPGAIVVRKVAFPISTLDDTATRIFTDRERIEGSGIRIVSTETDVEHNSVKVAVTSVETDTVEELANAYGVPASMLDVQYGVDSEAEDTAPLGGHAISACSQGAFGWTWDPLFGTVPYVVTAGHCANSLRHYNNGDENSVEHDPWYDTYSEQNSGNTDAQRMTIRTGGFHSTHWVENWNGADYQLVGSFGAGANPGDVTGSWVCQAGSRTQGAAGACGQIQSTNYNCGDHTGMRRVNYVSAGGDSGATVFELNIFGSDVRLAGFHEGLCNNQRRYTFVANARANLGLSGFYYASGPGV